MTHKELQSTLELLSEYQLNQISQTAMRFLTLNQELADIEPKSCPCCGDQNARFIRKGFLRGKQRFQCKSCGRKFTYDSKQLTSNSHQPVESWLVVLEDTLALESLDSIAEKIGVCHSTAFHMRHKLLVYMEEAVAASAQLEALIEADETYLLESQKGTKVTHRKPRRHGERSEKRGLSNEQMCVCVATDRDNHVIARCVNRAKPSSEDLVEALASHIAGKSVLLCDGAASYNLLVEKTDCQKISLVGHEAYNKLYHLNTVNNLHSRFKEMMRRFRGVSSKYLNRYAALFTLIAMNVNRSVSEAADHVRRSLRTLHIALTINSAFSSYIIAILGLRSSLCDYHQICLSPLPVWSEGIFVFSIFNNRYYLI